MPINYLKTVDELHPEFITLRERARLTEEVKLGNPDVTRWRGLFPRRVVRSTTINELERDSTARYSAGHREWNAQPYEAPRNPINVRKGLKIKPIEVSRHFGEEELTNLAAMGAGEDMVRQFLLESVGEVIPQLFDIVDRSIEYQSFEAWTTGKYTVRDNKGQSTSLVDLKLDPDTHYPDGDNAEFNDNAYEFLLNEIVNAQDVFGRTVGGIRASSQFIRKILSDAPVSELVTLKEVEVLNLLEQDLGYRVALVRDDRTVNRHTTGSPADTDAVTAPPPAEFYFPRDSIAFMPADGIVGYTAFVPVMGRDDTWFPSFTRKEDRADFTLVYVGKDGGRNLEVSSQANALSVPFTDSTYIVGGLSILPPTT